MPRVAAPNENPAQSSNADSGGVRKSGAVPMILAWIREEEELAKELFRIDIMMRPGATNWVNGTPAAPGRAPLVATTNTSM